ncbi:MAG: DMT family transporter [Pirellulaceae bacterium]
MSKLPYLWMLLGSFFFAVMSSLVHAAGAHCDWQVVAIARTLLALIFAALLVAGSRRGFVFLKPAMLWIRSIAGSISLVCGFYALARMPVADVLTLTNMFPLWVAVLSWPLLGAAPPRDVWLAVICGIGGVALIQQPHFGSGDYAWMVALAASFTSGVAMIGLHRLHHIDARAIVVHFSAVSLAFCIGALFLFPRAAPVVSSLTPITLLLLLGVGASATVGQLLLTVAFAHGDPARVSVVGLCQVGFAMVFDHLFWGRSFSAATLSGMALILFPTAWMMLRRGVRLAD